MSIPFKKQSKKQLRKKIKKLDRECDNLNALLNEAEKELVQLKIIKGEFESLLKSIARSLTTVSHGEMAIFLAAELDEKIDKLGRDTEKFNQTYDVNLPVPSIYKMKTILEEDV